MSNQVVQVSREKLVACMICPLCDKVFKDATTIAECLHTFCRKCIHDKLSDEDIEQCPVCNTNLGPTPLEKLRPDHDWQDLRAKIFPRKKRSKVNKREVPSSGTVLPEVTSGVLQPEVSSFPPKRKERSLSSLAFDTPKVSNQATVTGKRTKTITRKASAIRGSSFSIEKPIKIEEDHSNNSSSPEPSIKFSNNSRQSSSTGEPSQSPENKEQGNGAEPCEAKSDLWKPLNYLVEAASRSKLLRSSSQGCETKPEARPLNGSEVQGCESKSKGGSRRKVKIRDEKISADRSPGTAKFTKSRRNRLKKESVGEASISPQAILDSASGKSERRDGPVWLSLLASENQPGVAPLPQISARYLRIIDGSAYVSYIQKYLRTKLELASEEEVEIRCMGQPVDPALKIHNIVDLWLQSAQRSQRIAVKLGSPAEDFLVVLRYSRKVLHS